MSDDKRLDDWMSHCRAQHDELNQRSRDQHAELSQRIREIHQAVVGTADGEGIKTRVGKHSQRITQLDRDVCALKEDVDGRFDKLSQSLSDLTSRYWKIAIIMTVVIVGLNKIVPVVDVPKMLGL